MRAAVEDNCVSEGTRASSASTAVGPSPAAGNGQAQGAPTTLIRPLQTPIWEDSSRSSSPASASPAPAPAPVPVGAAGVADLPPAEKPMVEAWLEFEPRFYGLRAVNQKDGTFEADFGLKVCLPLNAGGSISDARTRRTQLPYTRAACADAHLAQWLSATRPALQPDHPAFFHLPLLRYGGAQLCILHGRRRPRDACASPCRATM